MVDRDASLAGRTGKVSDSTSRSSMARRFQSMDLASEGDRSTWSPNSKAASVGGSISSPLATTVGTTSKWPPPSAAASVMTRESSAPSEKDISTFFSEKAMKKEHYIRRGKHPASIKRESELFHYTDLSSKRRERISKGHKFWNVIDEETIEATIPRLEVVQEKKGDRRMQHPLAGSLGMMLPSSSEKVSTELQRLEMKVDFRNKSKLYYGMSFVIINYSQEILFVNTRDELRCKPLRLIDSADRIKFKLVDLLNPSNPKPVEFGASMWLQVLDNEGDNSIQHGHLLASKLFKLPQHSLINFDVLSEKDKERSDGEKQEASQQDMDDSSSRFNVAALKRSRRKRKSVLKEISRCSSRGYSFDDVTDGGSFPSSATADEESDDDDSISDQTNDKDPRHSDSLQGTATICGDLQVSRIIEVRKGDVVAVYEDKVLSDDQALRYTGKQALMTGRWMAHSAERKNGGKTAGNESSRSTDEPEGEGREGGVKSIHSAGTTATDVAITSVMSCSPIFIMQDLYCIATKHANEHKKWPPRSTMIINHSARIDKEQANIYRHAYQESAIVKTTLAQRMYQTGSTKLCDGDDEIDDAVFSDGIVSGGIAMAKKYRGSHRGSTPHPKGGHQYDYGCLRKVVRRGFPYDFSVDRKCVWQFCLFEQFSDTHLKLSVKDQAAKKVMETATMALKLSQLKREGAKEYSHSHSQDPSMPPLKSGGMFSKSLREINLKVFKEMDANYFHERRIKEARLRDHFSRHISEVLIMEKIDDEQQRTGKVSGSSSMSRSSSSIEFRNISGDRDNDSFLPSTQIPNLMHKPEMRRSAYLISTLPRNNRKNSITDSLSLYSSTASTLKAEPTAADSPNATTLRVGTTSSSSALPVQQRSNQQQANCQPSSPIAIDDAQSVTLSVVPPSTPGLEHLESVRKHFHIRTMSPSEMMLDSQANSNSFEVYNTLSEGEKLLAMHRTFHRVSEDIELAQRQQQEISNSLFLAATNQSRSYGSIIPQTFLSYGGSNSFQQQNRQYKQQPMSVQQQQREQREKKSLVAKPSIASKLAKLKEADLNIDKVLMYKDRLNRAKKDEKLEGVELSLC